MRLNPLPKALFIVARIDRQRAVGALNDADIDVNYADGPRTSVLEVTALDADLARRVLGPYLLPSLFVLWVRVLRRAGQLARFEIWRRLP